MTPSIPFFCQHGMPSAYCAECEAARANARDKIGTPVESAGWYIDEIISSDVALTIPIRRRVDGGLVCRLVLPLLDTETPLARRQAEEFIANARLIVKSVNAFQNAEVSQ